MVSDKEDRQTRLKIKTLEQLDTLPGFNRKEGYAKRVQALVDFCNNNGGFEKWMKNKQKKNKL